MKQSIHYFSFHSHRDTAKLAPSVILKQSSWVWDMLDTISFRLGQTASAAQRIKSFWQISWLWIWSGFGCTMALLWRASHVIWLNNTLAAPAIHSQPSQLLVNICPWVFHNTTLVNGISGSQAPHWGWGSPCLPQISRDLHIFGNQLSASEHKIPQSKHVFSCEPLPLTYFNELFYRYFRLQGPKFPNLNVINPLRLRQPMPPFTLLLSPSAGGRRVRWAKLRTPSSNSLPERQPKASVQGSPPRK